MKTRFIYLVRHGQYQHLEYDREKEGGLTVVQANELDGGLTSIGIEQTQLTAQRLSLLPISAIHCSTLPRAVETTEIVAREFPAIPVQRSRVLRECIPCVPPSLAEYFAQAFVGDLSQGRKQAERAFDKCFKRTRVKDKHEIVVCHGNLIRYFVCRILQAPPESWVNMNSYNCGISEVRVEPDGLVSLVSYNDVGHLPYHLRT
ncbi:MAG: histidine phosphatase family protein [Chloroflexota bacterium]|nr:histidine phosphatase family protein [Chloroflexota bacterium]